MSIKPFEKVLMLAIAAILIVSSAFSSVGAVNAETSMFEKGTSNVEQNEFNQIRNALKNTEEYQAYKENTKINSISKGDIIINTVDGSKGDIAYIEFVFGGLAKTSDNLAYVQFTYDVKNGDILTNQAVYAENIDQGKIRINAFYNLDGNQTEIYDITVDTAGTIFDEKGLMLSHDDFVASAEHKIQQAGKNADEFGAYASFCEYAVGALCGTGGGVLCYAAAGALGITTGIGGLGLAAVCALIGSVGCTAATDQICN
ncbi:halocin C8 precursor-like protein [Planococcus alpniumensis]|uniref:halocin C8 precursor-like protein n=1 Tax=Planococcus alpniumensis TaxID=2708345 RepID=UPI001B8B064E|nr:halocin C8 precursor-like protein [Planococcus sp. MSAK28401]